MSSHPKRHHFLPEFYLKGFTRNDLLWLYDRERKEFRCQTPRNTAVIGHYYAIENEKGEKDYSVEAFLAEREGKAKTAISKLETRAQLTPEERLDLAYFVALLMARSPKFDRVVNEVADAAAKQLIKHAVPTVEAAGEFVRRHSEKTGANGITPESMFKFIHDEEFKMVMSRNFVIETMLGHAKEMTLDVAMMNWLVVHPDKQSSFITTDEPIGFIVPDEFRQSGEPVLGLGSQKITKVVPLSQSVALLIGSVGGGLVHIDSHRDQVREMNITVATECGSYLIGRDEALVRSVVKRSKIDKSEPGTRMKVDHVPHPTDPNRTYLITRRVLADAPDKPIEIVVSPPS